MLLKDKKSISFYVEGEGNNVFIFSPFFPFNYNLIRNLILKIDLGDSLHVFSTLNNSMAGSLKDFHYKNFYDTYANLIESYEGKNINLLAFGVFSNLFLDLFDRYKSRIKTLTFFEPDFTNVLLKKINCIKRLAFFKFNSILDFYTQSDKIKKVSHFVSKTKYEYLKYFYVTSLELQDKFLLKNVINYIPKMIKVDEFEDKILSKINNDMSSYLLQFYAKLKNTYNLKEALGEVERNKIRSLLVECGYLTKFTIFWNIMAKETWPLGQVLIDANLPLVYLNSNFFTSCVEYNSIFINALQKQLVLSDSSEQ